MGRWVKRLISANPSLLRNDSPRPAAGQITLSYVLLRIRRRGKDVSEALIPREALFAPFLEKHRNLRILIFIRTRIGGVRIMLLAAAIVIGCRVRLAIGGVRSARLKDAASRIGGAAHTLCDSLE